MSETSQHNNFIKSLKPRRNSRYHQGYVDRSLLKKYYSEKLNEPIIYRSSLELSFINYCEMNPKIVKWASEPIAIPYYNRLAKHERNYYPDYVLENINGDRIIVEIKPYDQTVRPSALDSKWAKETWITNIDKWTAAKAFAEAHNCKFIIITEKFFQ